ncbi:MAG TPA: hypothetical protein VM261_16470 [Kofleriaceae bacterium]|nr:hypothetical protein [Kofleriaceae bacterium]
MIQRRDLLRGFGASAAVAALAPLVPFGAAACGRGRVKAPANVEVEGDVLRAALRDAVGVIGAAMTRPRAWVLSRRRVRVLVDVAVAEVVEERMTVAVLSGVGADGRRVERCFDEVTPLQVAAVAAGLARDAGGGGGGGRAGKAVAIPAPENRSEPVEVDPTKLAHSDWLSRARDIARRTEAAASSRIVYRAAWLATDDDRVWVVAEDGDRHQRLVRSRLGATLVAWQGSMPQFGEVEVAGGFGPAVTRVTDDAIARAAGDALALFTPTPAPVGRHVVLMDPGVVAALVDAHVRAGRGGGVGGAGGDGVSDRQIVKIVDEPATAGYARYWFDDDGVAGGHARRAAPSWRLREEPAQLAIVEGSSGVAELELGINNGLVIEGLRNAYVDAAGVAVMRVARARQLTGGSRTGRQWGDLEVRGSTVELLSDGIQTSRERSEIVVGDAPARAVIAPWLLTRAEVARARGGGSSS